MHDGMPYGRNQGQGQGHSREVDRQSPTGLIFMYEVFFLLQVYLSSVVILTECNCMCMCMILISLAVDCPALCFMLPAFVQIRDSPGI